MPSSTGTPNQPVRSVAANEPPSSDAPVRIEGAMPRALFDRLTSHDDAPRCRYDVHVGMAESSPSPASRGGLAARRRAAPAQRRRRVRGRCEFYLTPEAERAVRRVDGYLDVRDGLPAPDLVVEIDRSHRSRHKLGPYFRMGVREVWTSHRTTEPPSGPRTRMHPTDSAPPRRASSARA